LSVMTTTLLVWEISVWCPRRGRLTATRHRSEEGPNPGVCGGRPSAASDGGKQISPFLRQDREAICVPRPRGRARARDQAYLLAAARVRHPLAAALRLMRKNLEGRPAPDAQKPDPPPAAKDRLALDAQRFGGRRNFRRR